MKTQKLFFSAAIALFIFIGCNQKKEVKKEQLSLAISGMTCEIGCAKTIQSKLSKKEGVFNAKVIFTDSIANIEYDANAISKKDLIAFVDGIAGGDLYKAKEASNTKHVCTEACKESCTAQAEKSGCCSGKSADGKMAEKEDCKMNCDKSKTI